jgi:Ni/Fe-hydrogenase 1 B-type cytochrome subunit
MPGPAYERVYLWQRPVRVYHWLTVFAIAALVATGLVIGRPPALMSTAEASGSYWFGTVRLIHFVAAYVLLWAFVIRVYWMFVGNKYARWDNFLPWRPKDIKAHALEALNVLRVDILQLQKAPVDYLGHNAMAAMSYLALFAATLFQIFTGFALYAAMSHSWLAARFTWVVPLMGGDAAVRQWHHVATWFFVLFTMVHIHLAIYHDVTEGHGEISSMVSGARFHKRR